MTSPVQQEISNQSVGVMLFGESSSLGRCWKRKVRALESGGLILDQQMGKLDDAFSDFTTAIDNGIIHLRLGSLWLIGIHSRNMVDAYESQVVSSLARKG